MNTYTFRREPITEYGHSVSVLRNGKHIAQLNMFNPVLRRFNSQRIEEVIGKSAVTQLLAFGKQVTVQREDFISFI